MNAVYKGEDRRRRVGMTVTRKIATAAIGFVAFIAGIPALPPAAAQDAEPTTARIAWAGASFGLDPTAEYDSVTWEVYTSLLLRTLVTYRHVPGAGGNELVPDLATEIPQPSDDGLTYTFDLKPGVVFGPPVNRPITSMDIKYAFRRMVCRYCYGSYNFHYVGIIDGMKQGDRSIEGIETPDDDTVVFRLTRPTGDFLHRLAMPATAPIPKEVARCFPPTDLRRGYGRRLIATGPYMIEGSGDRDVSGGCEAMKPFSGYAYGEQNLSLVRNPNYDAGTDSLETREPIFDRFTFLNMSEREAFRNIEDGSLDAAMLTPSRRRVASYLADAEEHPAVHSNLEDVTWYATMNLTQKPFDDIHVRRALNWALDKPAVQEAWGGEAWADIATHIVPPALTGGRPSEYDPYGSLDGPDVERAREEMAASRYDEDGDGLCDAAACDSVELINRDVEPWTSVEPIVVEALETVGIHPRIRRATIGKAYQLIGNLSRGTPFGMNAGWAKDYADASTYFDPLFHSDAISDCEFSVNYSVVGGTPDTKKRCGAPGNFDDLPTVDVDIESCLATVGDAERDDCWIALDAKLTEDVVPWVPLLWRKAVHITGPGIGTYEFDQFTGQMSLAHIAP